MTSGLLLGAMMVRRVNSSLKGSDQACEDLPVQPEGDSSPSNGSKVGLAERRNERRKPRSPQGPSSRFSYFNSKGRTSDR